MGLTKTPTSKVFQALNKEYFIFFPIPAEVFLALLNKYWLNTYKDADIFSKYVSTCNKGANIINKCGSSGYMGAEFFNKKSPAISNCHATIAFLGFAVKIRNKQQKIRNQEMLNPETS